MSDSDVQQLIEALLSGERSVSELTTAEFKAALFGLSRTYAARIFNCMDPHGEHDAEWGLLSAMLGRAADAL